MSKQTEPRLPCELTIWTEMTPMERFAVMERVPYQRSLTRRLRQCLALVKAEMAS